MKIKLLLFNCFILLTLIVKCQNMITANDSMFLRAPKISFRDKNLFDTTFNRINNTLYLKYRDTIYGSEVRDRYLWFHNEGDRPVKILNTFTSDPCYVASFSHDPINPGDSGYLYCTCPYNDHETIGSTFTIITDDSISPQLKLNFKLVAKDFVKLIDTILYNVPKENDTIFARMIFKNVSGKPLWIAFDSIPNYLIGKYIIKYNKNPLPDTTYYKFNKNRVINYSQSIIYPDSTGFIDIFWFQRPYEYSYSPGIAFNIYFDTILSSRQIKYFDAVDFYGEIKRYYPYFDVESINASGVSTPDGFVFKFHFKNTGNLPLIIYEINAPEYASVKVDKNEYAVGEEGEIIINCNKPINRSFQVSVSTNSIWKNIPLHCEIQ